MNKGKSALVIIDMLYDFAHPDGAVFYPKNQEILPYICEILEYCRKKEMLIIFAQHYHRKNLYDKELTTGRRINCIEGSGGEELMPELQYNPQKEYIVKKRRYSAFVGTDLDTILKEHDVYNVIVCGTKTNCCIRATVEDAYHLEYLPIVIEDCVGTNDEVINDVHLSDIEKYLGKVITKEEFIQKVKRGELY